MTRSAIGASIQGSKKARRVAERPHCAVFCHNRPSMSQQTSQNTITSQGGRLSRSPMVHGPWIMGHDPTIQQPHNPIGFMVLRSYSPKAQVQSCPISLDISPSPTLRINLALPGTKKYQRDAKKPPSWVAFKFRWCRRRDLNPHARYVGTSTSS